MTSKTTSAKTVKALEGVLADTYVLAVKAHGFHWNVVGSDFVALHGFFGDQYEALFEAADDIAERIRALGSPAPASLAAFLKLTRVKEAGDKPLDAKAMIKQLLADNEQLSAALLKAAEVADSAEDAVTEDFLVGRAEWHDKQAWMLRSLLG
jgi:starvation-inducible DNA-binding protein